MGGPRIDRDIPKVKISKESISELLFVFKYVKPYKKYFIGGLIFISLSAFSTMLFPFLMGKMIGAVSNSEVSMSGGMNGMMANKTGILSEKWPLNLTLLLIFAQLSIQTIFSFMRVSLLTKAGTNAVADLRKDLYGRMISLPMSFFSTQRVGELSSRISADTGQIQDSVSFVFAEFLRGILTLIVGLFLIFFISTKLALIMLSIVPLIAISAVVFGGKIRKLGSKETDMLAESSTVVQETLQGISVVKAFTSESIERKRYGKNIDSLIDFAVKSGTYRGYFVSFIIFSVFGAIGFVVWYGANLIQQGSMGVGDLVMFVIFSGFVGGTLGGFADMFSQLQKTIGATQRVKELLKMQGESINESELHSDQRINGEIEFKDVEFSYPSRKEVQVLKGISFNAKKGEQIAIVGGSGGGKSTVAAMVMRFYDPDKGQILVDGKSVDTYDLSYLRSQIAYVPQDVILFGGTIYENILYGKPNASKEEVIEAAHKANALKFIESFPDKFETVVGERGIQLSGGQKQRIAIARAVIKNPAILVLDEATSALDSESELLVQEALDDLMKNRTSIVIAHRLSTIRSADKIIVLDKGQIVEAGRHEDLLKQDNGVYKSLTGLQVLTN
ncbi:MAG: ATP-binding cassette domain-containing protein [Bacteroidia bacterium]|nr:ATP-binding cassette domain-containing protein [Bacteroidia bacterium]